MTTLATTAAELSAWVRDARQRTFDLVTDLDDDQIVGPLLPIINPLLWEIAHVAWFQEKWMLRVCGRKKPIRGDGDALYDSAVVAHDTRWSLPLPSREETSAYMREVCDRVLDRLANRDPDPDEAYFIRLSVFHEDMHTEAFTYTRQTLGYPPPRFAASPVAASRIDAGPLPGDTVVPGGTFWLGTQPGAEPFVFDGGSEGPLPWGSAVPTPAHANLDWRAMDCVDVGAHAEGDSSWGCRQMIGNVWEWTSTDFAPYPGFTVDPYKEYSEPWFHTHKVLRGGAWRSSRRPSKRCRSTSARSCASSINRSRLPGPRLRLMRARSRLLVLTSRLEGGANVVSEAIAASVPVVSSWIAGSTGILGEDYPGYFPVGETRALVNLLWRAERDKAFYADLKAPCLRLQPLFDPVRERESWRMLLQEL